MQPDFALLLPPLFTADPDPTYRDIGDHDVHVDVHVNLREPEIPFHDGGSNIPEYVKDWDSFVGQAPLKERLRIHIDAALNTWSTLPHVMLASGMPGVGKTTLARLIAKDMGRNITMLVPPFTKQTLYDAAIMTQEGDFLFIDEIHKLADHGPAAAENLLHMLEEHMLYLDTGPLQLDNFCVIGATTEVDKLPEPIVDRFSIKPYFQPYSVTELIEITNNFASYFNVEVIPEVMVAIALACRGTPRVARELVVAARDWQQARRMYISADELLRFAEVDADGTTRQHKAYILALYQFFGRLNKTGTREFIAGEASLMTALRENKPGLARLERFLVERGLVDRTPAGRRLTDRGIAKAEQYVRKSRLGTE